MTPLFIPALLARQIEQEAARAYPNECCGILFGRDVAEPTPQRRIEQVETAENAYDAAERFHRFSIRPEQLMHAERAAAERGQVVLGFYHSHPDHPARPSDYDRTHAWPFYSYLIVSVAGGEPVDTTSWILDDQAKTFRRQDVVEA